MKSDYSIHKSTKQMCAPLLYSHHYLTGISRGFKSGHNYGLYNNQNIVGCCIYTGLPVPELAKGMFGLDRDKQEGLFELSRLVLKPEHQEREHNLASWFVARTIKALRKDTTVKAILSYAEDDYHQGTVYRALGFKYYGLTDAKSDFWIKQPDGSYIKHNRGPTKHLDGEWRPRSRKHRFVKVFDKSLDMKWTEV